MLETRKVTDSLAVDDDKAWRAIASIGGLGRWLTLISRSRVEGAGVGAMRILSLSGRAERWTLSILEAVDFADRIFRRGVGGIYFVRQTGLV